MTDTTGQRKTDHLELASRAQTQASVLDTRFDYEPLFFAHEQRPPLKQNFLGKEIESPFWVSSMTGGAQLAFEINQNLARLCGKYKLGMGLGSCRSILTSNERLKDFAVRPLTDGPLYGNLGIAQLEEIILAKKEHLIHEMVKRIEADGLIIHLNPLQEWFQPEGDRFRQSPLLTITAFLDSAAYPVIVKEVGHGMGPRSLAALMKLPLAGVEFGAFGGTNFTLLESLRSDQKDDPKSAFIKVGHTAAEMVEMLNALPTAGKSFIVSGGIRTVLDGYELHQKLKAPNVIGLAQAFLGPARESFEVLEQYYLELREAFANAKGLLKVKENL
jgi:isopentenyl-diphosphate delta-isomerase